MCVKTEAVYDLHGKLLSRRVGELQAHRQRQSSLAVVAVPVPPFRVTDNDRRRAHGESVTFSQFSGSTDPNAKISNLTGVEQSGCVECVPYFEASLRFCSLIHAVYVEFHVLIAEYYLQN